jgi:hypothetical protein
MHDRGAPFACLGCLTRHPKVRSRTLVQLAPTSHAARAVSVRWLRASTYCEPSGREIGGGQQTGARLGERVSRASHRRSRSALEEDQPIVEGAAAPRSSPNPYHDAHGTSTYVVVSRRLTGSF